MLLSQQYLLFLTTYPVSYTHLDVYKRQTFYIFGEKGTAKAAGTSDNIIEAWVFADGLDNPEEVKSEFSANPPNIYGFGHTPVSYTHLFYHNSVVKNTYFSVTLTQFTYTGFFWARQEPADFPLVSDMCF